MKLLPIIILLYLNPLFSQGFEKNIIINDNTTNESASYVEDYDGHLYIYLSGGCIYPDDTIACSAISKYDYEGEEIWTHIIDDYWLPRDRAFTIQNDTIYTVCKKAIGELPGNAWDYFKLYSLNTNGEKIEEITMPLDSNLYFGNIVHSVTMYHDTIFFAAQGLTQMSQLPAQIYGITKSGEQIFDLYWYPFDSGFRRFTISDFIVHPINQKLHFVTFEKNGIDDIRARRALYSINTFTGEVDSIFQTSNSETETLIARSRFKFNNNGDFIYYDDGDQREKNIFSLQYFQPLANLNWQHTFDNTMYQDFHDISEYEPLDLQVASNGDVYLSGLKEWIILSDSTWYRDNSFIAKFNSNGVLLWEKLITELSIDGVYNNKWQIILSSTILDDNSIIGVGESFEVREEGDIIDGWLIKLNEHGCFGNETDCGYMLTIDNTTSINEQRIKSLALEIYPNPTTNKAMVILPEGQIGTLSVLSMQGELIKLIKLDTYQQQFQVDVTELNSGNYILTFQPDDDPLSFYNSLLSVG